MPYYRKKFKRNYRRRRYPRRGYTTYGAAKYLARKAYQGVKYIRSMINVEKHYLDTGVSSTVTNTGSVTLLSGIAQGDDVNSRQGNSVLAKTLYGRCVLLRDSDNTTLMNSVRMMIVKDLENIGTAPTVTDILQGATVVSPLNVDHTSRYQVLLDKVYSLSLNGKDGMNLKYYLRVNDHLKYTGANATDVYKNAIYLLLISDQSAEYPTTVQNWRLGYYDN